MKEEFPDIRERILSEEEEQEREIDGYYWRFENMRENCMGMDPDMCILIEEQQELLNALREETGGYLEEICRHKNKKGGMGNSGQF